MMMERIRVLMYSERTDENAVCWIFRNEFNEFYFAPNYDKAEFFLLSIPIHIVIIDYTCKDYYDKIFNILYQRHLMAHILVLSLSESERLKFSHGIRSPDPNDTTQPNQNTQTQDEDITPKITKKEPLIIDDMTMDPNTKHVSIGDNKVRLTAMPFKLLCFLAMNHGQIVSFDQIKKHLWGDTLNTNEDVRTQIHRIRKKLSEITTREYIHNEKGEGYRFSK